MPPRASGKDLPFANVVQLAGEQVVTYERLSWDADAFELALYEPRRRVLPLPVGTLFNGDLAIRTERPERLVVTNWRTGEQVTAAEFDDVIESYEVAPDGRALVTVGDTLLEVAPGGAVTRLTPRSTRRCAPASACCSSARTASACSSATGPSASSGAHRAARALRHRRRQRAVERERLPAARADHRPGAARPRPGPVRAQ